MTAISDEQIDALWDATNWAPDETLTVLVRRFARALLAATPAADHSVDEAAAPALGMRLVPTEPTPGMLEAPPNVWPADAKVVWKHMLAAAPAAPIPPAVDAPVDSLQDRYDFVLAACRDAQDMASRYGWALHDIAAGRDDPVARASAAMLGTDGAPDAQWVERASALARELAVIGNSGIVPCSEGYGPVWEKYNALRTHLNTALGANQGGRPWLNEP